ncbi:hypothetical protein L873DRAFT_1086427 [Choiromyces venosus 120613-1]|uniref:Secreted protein n=1 Tax=Choiromyces venosus 120613-1 TaxID=1336337 RepID=A0A3N4JL80_9PEZI|nr:hypothetical protein L873DRAFT_1086427 [Choiromyces venosus 120613-1]
MHLWIKCLLRSVLCFGSIMSGGKLERNGTMIVWGQKKTRRGSYVPGNGDVGMEGTLFCLGSRDSRGERACNPRDCKAE